jgi:hypothetical protein
VRSSFSRLVFLRLISGGAVALAMMLLFGAQAKASTSRAETLEAIHHIENPRDSLRPGRYGELGPYQFRRSTWRMHTKLPFEAALNRETSEQVAITHYEWLSRGLARNGWALTPYNIALAWNGGLKAVVNGRASASTRDYAERVSNLANDLKAGRVAAVR